jgi:hypothetical protein
MDSVVSISSVAGISIVATRCYWAQVGRLLGATVAVLVSTYVYLAGGVVYPATTAITSMYILIDNPSVC